MGEILIAVLKSFCAKGISQLWENKKDVSLYLKTLFGKYRNKEIRFSISYLFRLKIPHTNSYLLVLNRRIENQLQPVGGVYKRYGDDRLFEKWNFTPDNYRNGLGTDEESYNDLRFTVKGKYVIDVIKWFEESKEREFSCEREFFEELIKPKIVDEDIFKQIKYKHVKRISKNLQWSEHHQCHEILIYDVVELIPTTKQQEFLIELGKSKNDLKKGFVIAECDDIEQLRYMEDGKQIARIGTHTKFIINKNC